MSNTKRIAHVVMEDGKCLVQTPALTRKLIETGHSKEVMMDFTRNPQFLDRPGNRLDSYVTVSADFDNAQNSVVEGISLNQEAAELVGISKLYEGITVVRGTEAGGIFVPEPIDYQTFFQRIDVVPRIQSPKDVLKMGKRLKRLFSINHGVCLEGRVVAQSSEETRVLSSGFVSVGSEAICFRVNLENGKTISVRVVEASPYTDGINTVTQTGAKKLGIDPSFRTGQQVTMLFPQTALGGFAKGLLAVVADTQQDADLVIIGPKKEISAAGNLFWFASMMELTKKVSAYTDSISITNFKGLQPHLFEWGKKRLQGILRDSLDENIQRNRIEAVVTDSLAHNVASDGWALSQVVRYQMQTGIEYPITSIPALFRRIVGSYRVEMDEMVQKDKKGRIRIQVPEESCASGYLCTELPTLMDGIATMNSGVLAEDEAFCRGKEGIAYIIRRPNAKPSSYLKKKLVGLDEIKARIDTWVGITSEQKDQLKQQWDGYKESPWLFLSVEDAVTRRKDLETLDGADNDDLTVAFLKSGLDHGFSFGDQRFPPECGIPENAKLTPADFLKAQPQKKASKEPFVLNKGHIAEVLQSQKNAISIGVFVNPGVVFSNICQRLNPKSLLDDLLRYGIKDISWLAHNQEMLIDGVNKDGVEVTPTSDINEFWLTVPVIPAYCETRIPKSLWFQGDLLPIDEARAKAGRKPIQEILDYNNEVDQQLAKLRELISSMNVEVPFAERHIVQNVMPEQIWWKALESYPLPKDLEQTAVAILEWHKRNILNLENKFFNILLEELAPKLQAEGRDTFSQAEVERARSQARKEAVSGHKTSTEYIPGAVHILWNRLCQVEDPLRRKHLVIALLRSVYTIHRWTYTDRKTGEEKPRSVKDGFLWSGRMIEHTLDAIHWAIQALPEEQRQQPQPVAVSKPRDVRITLLNGSRTKSASDIQAWKAQVVGVPNAILEITPDGQVLVSLEDGTEVGRVGKAAAQNYVNSWGVGQYNVRIEDGSPKTVTAVVQY